MVQDLAAGRDSGLKDSPGSPYQGEAVRSVFNNRQKGKL
jgi:hypothetical protein